MGGGISVRIAAAIAVLLLPLAAAGEDVWVKDEVHLQLRTGAGNGFRIIGRIKTGDSARILQRSDGWTKIRTGGKDGWVPAGFLIPEPPARIALEELETEAAGLRDEVRRLTREGESLRANNDEIGGRDAGQRSEIDTLKRENYELRAGARWPEWITGAGIVLIGMLLGWLLSRGAGRRRQQRIRL
jgi:SH3 domain protein